MPTAAKQHRPNGWKPTPKRDYDRNRPNAAKRGYNAEWRRQSKQYLITNPECVFCKAKGKLALAVVVDHIRAHRGNARLFWDHANWQGLCQRCHNSTKQRMEAADLGDDWQAVDALLRPVGIAKPALPVTVVCGPPGGGKTTFAEKNTGHSDVVIDLDDIKAELSGLPWYAAGPEWSKPALIERNRRLAALSCDGEHGAAWFIVAAPTATERRRWRDLLGAARVVVIETPLDDCIRRLAADRRRDDRAKQFVDLARTWWSNYSSDRLDIVVRP